tara:strand:+ start:5413 stop:7098 length:1686 start_codon:yes stop_codon:yes gene_type:complete
MDEDEILYQSIIADPERVDPDVDVSRFKTATPTSPALLADVAEYSGLQFDPTQTSYIADLYDLYSTGVPVIETPDTGTADTAQILGAADTLVDVGGEDQVTGGLPTTNELLEQGLSPTGVATITPNVFDYESEAAGVQPTGLDPNVFDYESEAAGVQPTGISPNVFDYESEAAGIQPTGISPNVFDYEFEATTPEQRAEALTQEQIEQTGIIDKAVNALGNVTPDQVVNAIRAGRIGLAALTQGGSEVINEIGRIIGGTIIGTAAADVTADKLLQSTGALTPTSTAEDIALNLQQQQAALDPDQNIMDEVALTGGSDITITKDNAADYLNEQLDKSLAINAERREMLTPERQQELIEEQNKTNNNINNMLNNFPETSEQVLADRAEKAQANVEIDLPTSPITFESDSGGDDTSTTDTTSSVDEADVEAGLATESISDFSDVDAGTADEQSGSGGDSGGGGGKIVCTMMNKTYGFGSFRNKIWLRQSKDLAPEYQKGYHILFLPLVKVAETNKIVRKILEHIAVHRTIDIRQESRGKTHMLGRMYRKILEPICYWVGKYAKR